MEPLAKRHKVASLSLEHVTDGEHQSTTAVSSMFSTMLEDTADNHTIQPHGDQSELRPTPRGRPEATHGRESPGAHHIPATGPSKQHLAGVRRISLSKSHTPSYRDVLSGVSDLFRVPPSGVESSFLLKYRDHEGDF